MGEKEKKVIEEIDTISKRGNSAEVKKDKDGKEITRLELTVFSISIIDNNTTQSTKGKFDR